MANKMVGKGKCKYFMLFYLSISLFMFTSLY